MSAQPSEGWPPSDRSLASVGEPSEQGVVEVGEDLEDLDHPCAGLPEEYGEPELGLADGIELLERTTPTSGEAEPLPPESSGEEESRPSPSRPAPVRRGRRRAEVAELG